MRAILAFEGMVAGLLTGAVVLLVLGARTPHRVHSEDGSAIPPRPVELSTAVTPQLLAKDIVDLPEQQRGRILLVEPRAGDLLALFHEGTLQGCFVVLQPAKGRLALAPSPECGRATR